MPVQLFGISKAPLYRFLASSINLFPPICVAIPVDSIFMVLPDVPGDYFDEVCRLCALGAEWACSALCGILCVVTISKAVGSSITEYATFRTGVAISSAIV